MNDRGARRALDEARDVLTHTYARARAAGYQPGSPAMQDLERAERHYQQARRHAHSAPEAPASDPAGSRSATGDVVLDLTDEGRRRTQARPEVAARAAVSEDRPGQPAR